MYDTIILGNGIAGMSAAIYAKRANLNFKIIGEDEFSVGQIENAVLVENYPGIKAIRGYDLGNSIKEQLEENNIEIEENTIESIEEDGETFGNTFTIAYADGREDITKTVIYALGAKHRPLSDICDMDKDVIYHHCAICDGPLYKNKTVVLIGGGNTAFTEALYLSNIAKKVIIITDKIVADKVLQKRAYETENIHIHNHSCINKIYMDRVIRVNFTVEGIPLDIHTDGLFAAIGTIPQSQYCPEGIKLINNYVLAPETGETNIKGFYVAGDVRYKKLRQAITAAADGANCVNSVVEYLKHN